jgi:type II secretory pathway pseudopilin PulG
MSGTVRHRQSGYAMVALLVGMSIMAIALSVALPTWSTAAKREREEELIFRGRQYARAVTLYQRKFANAFPPSFDVLVRQKFLRKKFADPMTEDGEFQPVYAGQGLTGPNGRGGAAGTQAGAAANAQGGAGANGQGGTTSALQQSAAQQAALTQSVNQVQPGGRAGGQPGLIGVVSKSDAKAMRLFNGRDKYNEWMFVATEASTAAGARGGAQRPNGPNGPANAGRGRLGGTGMGTPGGFGAPGGLGTPGGTATPGGSGPP